jgi:hypothetical protein
MNSRLAAGAKASFFFHPVQLHLELPNLLVELGWECLVVALSLVTAYREKLGPLLLQAMFPLGNLGRMPPVGTGSFVDGFASFERFERHTSFELRAVLISLCQHLLSPHSHLLWTQHSI